MKKFLLALLPVALLLVSCGKDNPDNPEPKEKSSACSLVSFQFKSDAGAGMVGTANAVFATIQSVPMAFITVPEGVDLHSLKPTFSISDKATLTAGGKAVESGKTAIDFSSPIELKVTAENGSSYKKCLLVARNGDATIDNEVYAIMKEYDIPGIGIATTKKEVATYSAGYGFANMDSSPRVQCRPDMLFRLASMSKAQTALCIMTLVEEGKLSLDDYVFAPGTGILADKYPGEHGNNVDLIKIRHLLTHTSGWKYATTDGVDPIFTGDGRFYGKSLTERVAYMVKTSTSVEPGSLPSSYYNLGFCVLGQVIEKVSGVSYEEFLRSVVEKAGVKDMWVAKTAKADRRANECVYYPQGASTAYGNDMTVVGACGAVIASPLELMKLLSAEDYGTVVPDILTKESLDQMYTNYTVPGGKAGYGFGWRIEHNTLTNWASYHGGNISGTATIWVRGKNGVNGVLLCNSRSQKDGFDTALYLSLNAIMERVNLLY